jgi:hypothetical protein
MTLLGNVMSLGGLPVCAEAPISWMLPWVSFFTLRRLYTYPFLDGAESETTETLGNANRGLWKAVCFQIASEVCYPL